MANIPLMTDEILGEFELARLLKIPQDTLSRLLAETPLPRFFIGGEVRFITSSVLAFCHRHEGLDLLPLRVVEAVEGDAAEAADTPAESPDVTAPVEVPPLPTAAEGEQSWVSREARDALVTGVADPGRNLDRLKLRDALLELNDALLPALTRLSVGRLHPHYDEKSRTSPWRLDFDGDSRIEAISIAWGAGDHAPPRFGDRPHIEVELDGASLKVILDSRNRNFDPVLVGDDVRALAAAGFALLPVVDALGTRVCKSYPMADPAPSTPVVARILEHDLELLVPLWARLV